MGVELKEAVLLDAKDEVVTHEPVTFGWIDLDPVYNSPPKGNLKANWSAPEFKEFPSIEEGFITKSLNTFSLIGLL